MNRLGRAAALWALLVLAGCKGNVNNGSLPLTTTDRISVGTGNVEGNGMVLSISISEDGNVIAFSSTSTNLVPETGVPMTNVFVRNVSAGTTELVSINAAGSGWGNAPSDNPQVSADGRFVAFASAASDLVPGDTNAAGAVYRRDLTTKQTIRVTVNNAGGDTAAPCTSPSISEDGQFVAFVASMDNVATGVLSGPNPQIHRRDMNLAPGSPSYVRRISANFGGVAGSPCASPSISGDGASIVFHTGDQTMLSVAEVNIDQDVFLWSATGPGTGITRLSNKVGGGEASGQSTNASISLDGQWIVFQSTATDLTPPGSIASSTNVYLVPRTGGDATLVNVSSTGLPAVGGFGSQLPSISRDGRFVVFTSDSANLFPGDINGASDVIIRDVDAGLTIPASVRTYGAHTELNAFSYGARISGNGRFAAFVSDSAVIAPDDSNGLSDGFRRGPF